MTVSKSYYKKEESGRRYYVAIGIRIINKDKNLRR